jgi:hypothetical protein
VGEGKQDTQWDGESAKRILHGNTRMLV